jgi:E3 ubiquitin-protein ligase AIP2
MLTLLQARYSDVAFWHAGREVFLALRARLGDCNGLTDAALQARALCASARIHGLTHVAPPHARRAAQRCAEVLAEDDDGGGPSSTPPQRRPAGALFEGQLGLSGGDSAGVAAAAPAPGVALPPEAAALAALLGIDVGGMEAEDGGLEGLEEALRASLEEQSSRPVGPPPAGRDAVRALRVETLTPERLASLGAGVVCAVCREELAVGNDVRVMPCSDAHAFHVACLTPWLEAHNSCPVCRHELPTDDWRYEERKERAARDADDARGAANARRGGEFLYL